jgi:hypothetical protein
MLGTFHISGEANPYVHARRTMTTPRLVILFLEAVNSRLQDR